MAGKSLKVIPRRGLEVDYITGTSMYDHHTTHPFNDGTIYPVSMVYT